MSYQGGKAKHCCALFAVTALWLVPFACFHYSSPAGFVLLTLEILGLSFGMTERYALLR